MSRPRGRFLRRRTHTHTGHHHNHDGARSTREVTLASAQVVGRAQIRRTISTSSWQQELWDFYDTTGELRFATGWLANAVSRCGLYIGTFSGAEAPTPIEGTSADEQTAQGLLDALHYGPVGHAEMLRRITLHLSIPGESYLIGMDPDPADTDVGRRWYVASSDEIKVNTAGATLTLPDSGQTVKIHEKNSTIIRLWRPHARRGWMPDSTLRATLPVLREIRGLSDYLSATLDSRLAGAGILFVPTEASLPEPEQGEGETPLHKDPYTAMLMESMLTPLSDRDDASAVVPIVSRIPGDQVDNVKHVRFDTELTEKIVTLRDNSLDRFAAGSDIPKEFITGTRDMNHWGVSQLEDSAVKLYIEPLAGCICDAFTQQYLWPALRASGVQDPEKYVVWFNPSELTQRPNKGPEAQSLWDKGVLSDSALRRENGFSEDDAPTPEEHQLWLQEKLILSSGGSAMESNPTSSRVRQEPPDSPTPQAPRPLSASPDTVSNQSQDPAVAWWLRAVEQATLRALELAGKRLVGSLSREHRHRDSPMRQVPAWEIHTQASALTTEQINRFLDGAYDIAQVNFGSDECVLDTIQEYCQDLLRSGVPHRREYLAGALARSGCAPVLGE